jgi:DNA-binding NarL/FixJ family response regulator
MARVLLVTDAGLAKLGFEALAGAAHDVETCPASGSIDRVKLFGPFDLIVVEESSASGDIVSLCAALVETNRSIPVLLLTESLIESSVRAAIEAGARGVLGKDEEPQRLRWAIEWLLRGQSVLDPRIVTWVLGWLCEMKDAKDGGLSGREVEVLKMVGAGESNKRIARSIGVAENTVRTYLQRSFRKLGCHTRSSAAAEAIKRGLI